MMSRLHLEFTSTSFVYFFIPLLLHFTTWIAHPGWTTAIEFPTETGILFFPLVSPDRL